VSGTGRTSIGRELSVATTAASILVLIYVFVPFDGDLWWVGAIGGLAVVVAIVPWTVRRVRAILVSERPVIEGVVVIALLFVLLVVSFSLVYYTLEHHATAQFADLDTKLDSVYFVVSTLATVGFGDVHATGQLARAIVTLQIVFDVAFLGLTLRVVTSAARHRMEETGGPSHLMK
jgi:voltage-gated potassium channel